MTNLEVRFTKITVSKISDPGVNAEAEFTFTVNGQTKKFADNNLGVGVTAVNRKFNVAVPDTGSLTLRVTGIEQDTTSGDDQLPGFTKTFTAAQKFGAGTHRIAASNAHMSYVMDVEIRQLLGPAPLSTTYTAEATLTTTNDAARGPFTADVSIGLLFNAARTTVTVESFQPVTVQTDNGPVTISLAGSSTGTFNESTGALTLPVELLFDLPIVVNSTLPITLTTGAAGGLSGAPLDSATRRVKVVGAAGFDGGFLGDDSATVSADGTLAVLP